MVMLEEMPEEAEIRLVMQPSWPMQHTVYEVVLVGAGEYEDEDGFVEAGGEDIVFLVDGGQVRDAPYLPAFAQSMMGW